MAELCVDQIGQRRPVFRRGCARLAAKPACVGRAGARLRHLGQAQVDRVGEDRGQQQVLVFGRVARFQMRKCRVKPVHSSPPAAVRDLDVRQDHCRLWSISAWAVSGTAASSGVIFQA